MTYELNRNSADPISISMPEETILKRNLNGFINKTLINSVFLFDRTSYLDTPLT